MSFATKLERSRSAGEFRGHAAYPRLMGRPLRPQVEDGIYHATARGNRRSTVFFDDEDRRVFLAFLQHVLTRDGFLLLSYCLMTTHFHLIVRTPRANISQGMHRLNTRYATWFNDRHAQIGHVFQGRFHSVLLETEEQLLRTYRYVALNPVRAGICVAPSDWFWSSYAALRWGPSTSPRIARKALSELFGDPRGLHVSVDDV